MGAFVLTLRIAPEPGRDAELVEALREAMPRFVTLPRITGAHLIRNDVIQFADLLMMVPTVHSTSVTTA